MAANLDLPPSYITIQGPPATLTIDAVEEAESKSDESKDDEEELLFNDSFEDKTTRLIFIQKVLTIKLLQVLGIFAFMCSFAVAFVTVRRMMYFNTIRVHLIVTSALAYLLTLILLICCDNARRRNPYKYIFLVAYPLSIAYFISSVTYWDTICRVGMASIYYCAAMFAVLLYSIFIQQTKFDFVTLHGTYISIGVQAVIYALTVPLFYFDAFGVLYVAICLTLDHVYILYALRVMTTKDYKRQMTPDDYVDAAINLHIDYIYIIIKHIAPKICTAFAKCATVTLRDPPCPGPPRMRIPSRRGGARRCSSVAAPREAPGRARRDGHATDTMC